MKFRLFLVILFTGAAVVICTTAFFVGSGLPAIAGSNMEIHRFSGKGIEVDNVLQGINDPLHRIDDNQHPSTEGHAGASSAPVAPPASTAPSAPLFAVDERGVTVGDRRVDVSAADAQKTAEEIVSRASPGRGVVSVSASRNALFRWVGVVVRALGRTGVEEVDIVTSTSTPLKLSPLGQVPMHEARCGARITFRSDGTAELQYMNKAKTKLAEGPNGPDVSRALGEMLPRMQGCESTLFMLAADQDAKWGPAFDVGRAVGASELSKGTTTRYIMLP